MVLTHQLVRVVGDTPVDCDNAVMCVEWLSTMRVTARALPASKAKHDVFCSVPAGSPFHLTMMQPIGRHNSHGLQTRSATSDEVN